jgi:hypothetical protein
MLTAPMKICEALDCGREAMDRMVRGEAAALPSQKRQQAARAPNRPGRRLCFARSKVLSYCKRAILRCWHIHLVW